MTPPRVLDTREIAPGVRRRRYERADGTRYTTIEVPATVLRGVASAKRVEEALATWHRGEAARALAASRKARAWALLREGVKPAAIAHELGVSDARVRQWRAEWRRASDGR